MTITFDRVPTGWNAYTESEYKEVRHYELNDIIEPPLVAITYSELKTLRDNSQLIAGQQYRITDYTCTTTQTDTQSAGNIFDIIVTADSDSTLNENARAIQHDGDTYFSSSNLAAWELKYSLDNDTNRFAWADSTNGKGVIYYMKDEFNNECPYDFKNIQFLSESVYYYTFDLNATSDHSLNGSYCYGNIMKPYYVDGVQTLNANIFKNTSSSSNCYSNTFGDYCYSNIFGDECYFNTFGNNFYSNTFGDDCDSNTFGDDCYSNTFGNYFYSNTFGNNCYSNTFGKKGDSNTFGNYCYSNTFGDTFQSNTFGDSCQANTFYKNCYENIFGNDCCSNAFGNYCRFNTFKNYFRNSTIGAYCYYNTFGNYCYYCNITGGTSSSNVRYCKILEGTKGTSSSDMLTITFATGMGYTQVAGLNSSGELKIWVPADLV